MHLWSPSPRGVGGREAVCSFVPVFLVGGGRGGALHVTLFLCSRAGRGRRAGACMSLCYFVPRGWEGGGGGLGAICYFVTLFRGGWQGGKGGWELYVTLFLCSGGVGAGGKGGWELYVTLFLCSGGGGRVGRVAGSLYVTLLLCSGGVRGWEGWLGAVCYFVPVFRGGGSRWEGWLGAVRYFVPVFRGGGRVGRVAGSLYVTLFLCSKGVGGCEGGWNNMVGAAEHFARFGCGGARKAARATKCGGRGSEWGSWGLRLGWVGTRVAPQGQQLSDSEYVGHGWVPVWPPKAGSIVPVPLIFESPKTPKSITNQDSSSQHGTVLTLLMCDVG